MKKLPSKNYPADLRAYVWHRHCQGARSRAIFDEVMERWPDCGMKTFRSICMMLGPLKVAHGKTGRTYQRHVRSGEIAPRNSVPARNPNEPAPITLAGPVWSRGAA